MSLIERLEKFSKSYEELLINLHRSVMDIELRSYEYEEKSKKSIDSAKNAIIEMDYLIQESLSDSSLNERGREIFLQILVSFKPRIESYLHELEEYLVNPPPEKNYDDFFVEKNEENEQKVDDIKDEEESSSTEEFIEKGEENTDQKNEDNIEDAWDQFGGKVVRDPLRDVSFGNEEQEIQ